MAKRVCCVLLLRMPPIWSAQRCLQAHCIPSSPFAHPQVACRLCNCSRKMTFGAVLSSLMVHHRLSKDYIQVISFEQCMLITGLSWR